MRALRFVVANKRRLQRQGQLVILLLCGWGLIILQVLYSDAYSIPSYSPVVGVVPVQRQRAWLHQCIAEMCLIEPGHWSLQQLQQAPLLMRALSRIPSTSTRTRKQGQDPVKYEQEQQEQRKENAVAVEKLLQRLIQERYYSDRASASGNDNNHPHNPTTQFQVTIQDYNCVLDGWARSKLGATAALRNEQILQGLLHLQENQQHQQQEQEDHQHHHHHHAIRIQPDLHSFKATLEAWKQASMQDRNVAAYSPMRVQIILETMLRRYIEYCDNNNNEKDDLALSRPPPPPLPDLDCFVLALQLWSRSNLPHAPYQAEQLLQVLIMDSRLKHHVQPNTACYNAILTAYSRKCASLSSSSSSSASTSIKQASDRSCQILALMERSSNRQSTTTNTAHTSSPDTVSYCTVMSTLAKHPDSAYAAQQADYILNQVETTYLISSSTTTSSSSASSMRKVVPQTIMYNTALGCWARSNLPGAYLRAQSILDRQTFLLRQHHCTRCPPDVIGYTSVLAACAAEPNARNHAHAFHVALNTFRSLCQEQEPTTTSDDNDLRLRPNHVTYGVMLKVVAKLLPVGSFERIQYTQRIFQSAVNDGCVGTLVLRRMREAAASATLVRSLLHGQTLSKAVLASPQQYLPPSWTRNAQTAEQQAHANLIQKKKKMKNKKLSFSPIGAEVAISTGSDRHSGIRNVYNNSTISSMSDKHQHIARKSSRAAATTKIASQQALFFV